MLQLNESTPAGLTPEQQLELAKAQAETEKWRLEAAKEGNRLREAEEAHTKLLTERATRAALLESGIAFHDKADEAALKLAESYDLRYDEESGKMVGYLDGKQASLAKILAHIASERSYLVSDKRSLRGKGGSEPEHEAEKPTKARSEFTMDEKIALLNKPGGLAIWESLPAYPTKRVPLDDLTMDDWRRLPVAERTRIVAQRGTAFVEQLARKKHLR